MNKLFVALAAAPLALATSPALAAPFAGPYIGVEGSHDSFEVKAKNTDLGGLDLSADGLSGNGVAGSIYAGYDMPIMSSAFVGVEAGFAYSGAAISASATDGSNTFAAKIRARETYSIAARLGATFSASTGVYAKVGYANTRFKTTVSSNGSQLFADSRSAGAFVYGGGIETAINDRVTVRGEFTVADYGSAGLNEDLGVNGIKVSNSKTSVGLSYHF
jgi:Opacity protein and related surface antigens